MEYSDSAKEIENSRCVSKKDFAKLSFEIIKMKTFCYLSLDENFRRVIQQQQQFIHESNIFVGIL